jgi:hypothetical protein
MNCILAVRSAIKRKFALQIFAGAHVHGLWQAMHKESKRDFAI